MSSNESIDRAEPRLFSARYRVQSELARGGMARVYRVIDERSGEALALKQLSVSSERTATLRAMFEREYHTLVQLAHPRIVRVFDFGVDGDDPYYVMELLEGVDAREAARAQRRSVREICVWLRDCASALALVHSRRMVHRDVGPRNLWCTPDGRAKLIDFGTLVAMGPQTRIAGTPPYVPPEAVNAQALDARCDLYALGALAYWLLTDRAAFPARSLAELPELWQRRPERPDVIRPDVPKALADLVMALLSFDPRGRPASASEVFQRLTRIADLPAEDEESLAQAFLASPQLVGRDDALTEARKRLRRVVGRRGTTFAILADSGLGRSRLLADTVLEAKLIGATAITASATAVASGPLGLATSLAERLLEAQPLAAAAVLQHAAVLAQLSPELDRLLGNPAPVELGPFERIRKQSEALVALFRAASRDQSLVVGVDDVHRADSASLAILAKLSMLTKEQRLLLVITCDAAIIGHAPPALEQLVRTRHTLRLQPLAAEHTRQLMASLFGEVPGLDAAAHWLHEISQGSPTSCMQYAQYLVDRGLARYEGGHWQLPLQLQQLGLPSTLGTMFEQRVGAMSADARALALSLALARDESRAVWQPESHVAIEDFPKLLGCDSARAFAALDELLRAGALQQRDQFYVLGQRALVDVLMRATPEDVRIELHRRIADIYGPRGGQARWMAIRQLLLAGDQERARALLVEAATQLGTSPADFGAMRVSVCADTARATYAHWRAGAGSIAEGIQIRRLMLIVCSVYDWSLAAFGKEQLAQLSSDCGLGYWNDTDAAQPDLQRVLECLKRAGEAHAAKPVAERGLEPLAALRELAGAAMALSGAAVNSHDLELARTIPGIFKPLRSLTPLLALLGDLCELGRKRVSGCELGDRTFEEGATQLLASQGLPDVLRMGAAGVNVHIQCVEDARRGRPQALERIELLVPTVGEDMFLVVHARWLGNAYRGNSPLARRYFNQVQMITEDDVWRRKAFLFAEAELHALTGDAQAQTGVCDAIAELTEKFPGWRPWLAYARAALHRARGDIAAARATLEPALPLAPVGEHRAWTRLAPAYAEVLLLAGDAPGALFEADTILTEVRARGLDRSAEVAAERIGALALSALGNHAPAQERLERAFAVANQLGYDGLPLALLYEAAARIALVAGAGESRKDALAQLWRLIEKADAPAMINAYESLRVARKDPGIPSIPSSTLVRSTFDESTLYTEVQTRLAQHSQQRERMRQALTLLLEDSNASAGHLLLIDQHGLFAAASVNDQDLGEAFTRKAQEFFDAQLEVKTVTVTASVNDQAGAPLEEGDRVLSPVMLIDRGIQPAHVVGVVLLAHSARYRTPRAELVRIVSRCLREAGDTNAIALDD